jgi:predicted dehydrogenase
MDVQTYFFRRTNMNALGQARSWTDHLLWHHAAHTVDLFAYQARSPIVKANAVQGPIHPTLGIAMDMSIQLKAANGAICTLSLSFNNDGPLGTFFRYIGDTGTYLARYDDLFNGKDEKIDVSRVDVSMNGIELQDREFFAAIREGRETGRPWCGRKPAGMASRLSGHSFASLQRILRSFLRDPRLRHVSARARSNAILRDLPLVLYSGDAFLEGRVGGIGDSAFCLLLILWFSALWPPERPPGRPFRRSFLHNSPLALLFA